MVNLIKATLRGDCIEGLTVLTPDELRERARGYGAEISARTLARFAAQSLIDAPEVRSLGRGLGRHSEYPPIALAEAVAASKLMADTSGEIITRYEVVYGPFVFGGGASQYPVGGRVRAVEVAMTRQRAYTMKVGDLVATAPGVQAEPPLTDEEQATRLRWIRILATWLTFRQCVKEGLPIPEQALVSQRKDGGPVSILEIETKDPSLVLVDAAIMTKI